MNDQGVRERENRFLYGSSRSGMAAAIASLSALLLLLSAIYAPGAWAASSGRQWTYYSTATCTQAESEVYTESGTNRQIWRGKVWAKRQLTVAGAGIYSCATEFRVATGFLAVNPVLMKWTGSAWAVCYDGGFKYSTAQGDYYSYLWYNPAGGQRGLCGAGYYLTANYAYHYNGGWLGGGPVYSPYESFL